MLLNEFIGKVLAHYVQLIVYYPSGVCRQACLAFLACCDLLDLLMVVNLGFVIPAMVHTAVDNLLRACLNSGWKEHMITKFH